jgi:DNA-binding CsgD family transcriptional regulator
MFAAAFIGMGMASALFARPGSLRIISAVGIVALFATSGLSLPAALGGAALSSPPLLTLKVVARALLGVAVIATWRLRLARLDALRVKDLLVRSLFLAVPFFLASIHLPDTGSDFLLLILPLVSLLASFFVDETADAGLASSPPARAVADMAEYFGTRVITGIVIGFALALQVATPWNAAFSVTLTEGLVIAVSLASLVMFVVVCRSTWFAQQLARKYFPILPFAGISLVSLPFVGSGILTVAKVAIVTAMLSWYILNFMQLPLYRDILGMRAALLVFATESVVFLSWAFGKLLGFLLVHLVGDSYAHATVYEYFSIGLTYFAVLGSAVLIIRANSKNPLATDGLAEKDSTGIVCDAIAQRYGLTVREGEVLRLLAAGYTQPLIGDVLNISQSTIKTHIGHIYQKAMVKKKQELIELIEHTRGQLEKP